MENYFNFDDFSENNEEDLSDNYEINRRIDLASRGGEQFITQYLYPIYDECRFNLIKLYTPKSTCVWNGQMIKGLSNLDKFFRTLPSTKHEILTIDCQPVSVDIEEEQNSDLPAYLVVFVFGKVKYRKNRIKQFSHTINLFKEGNTDKYFILNDCFRFVED
eukprot:TRINITY_DN11762_c0_g1_i1.p1 TRINITY_DN11762_c0_g1~~TRINITY_DN11762_c0_g1_i1.p1  ORF type:complete len:161 (+),score=24.77 TRINITY_DN11762_c0_g1_i1:127-609(+)